MWPLKRIGEKEVWCEERKKESSGRWDNRSGTALLAVVVRGKSCSSFEEGGTGRGRGSDGGVTFRPNSRPRRLGEMERTHLPGGRYGGRIQQWQSLKEGTTRMLHRRLASRDLVIMAKSCYYIDVW
jgi:hypothetical protein